MVGMSLQYQVCHVLVRHGGTSFKWQFVGMVSTAQWIVMYDFLKSDSLSYFGASFDREIQREETNFYKEFQKFEDRFQLQLTWGISNQCGNPQKKCHQNVSKKEGPIYSLTLGLYCASFAHLKPMAIPNRDLVCVQSAMV